jgi:hypothetical protein
MRSYIHFIPILTTVLTVVFSTILFRHWRRKPSRLYLFWWFFGVVMYGAGTLTESLTTLFGWNEWVFKSWYVTGAFLGGAPLAQGTVYLLLDRKLAHGLTALLVAVVAVGSVFVFLSPINHAFVEEFRLSGKALEWTNVRLISPFINIYAFIFLVGGAVWSAWKYLLHRTQKDSRYWGNIWIAVGALLPGIGGTSARAGFVEVLYVTEFVGLLFIWLGYYVMTRDAGPTIHANQVAV